MRQLSTQDADFDSQLIQLLAFETVNDVELLKTVDDIIAKVRHGGDSVVLTLTQEFDQHPAKAIQELELSKQGLSTAFGAGTTMITSATPATLAGIAFINTEDG